MVCLCSCGDDALDAPLYVSNVQVPDDFLFGAATTGFQVDMGCPTLARDQCADEDSDWYQFVTDEQMIAEAGNHLSGEDPAEVGPGHWELYETDFDLAADELHSTGFRMSLEWSRLFPNPTDDAEGYQQLAVLADQAAVDHYHEVFAALRERNLIPLVTLHHYTMPAWLHDGVSCHFDLEQCENRGWVDRERAVREITKYAGFVAREFAGEVDLWATQNEPFAVVLPGYLLPSPERVNPPSVTLAEEAARTAMVAMIEAHARMVEAVRTSDRIDADGDGAATSIGLVYAMAPVVPRNPEDAVDVRAAENVFYLWNLVFLDAVILGQLDADMSGEPVYRSDLEVPMDWLGINYKVRARVRGAPRSAFPEVSPLLTVDPTSIDFTEVHAAGLYQMIELVHQRYALPVIITENNGQNVPTGDIELEIRYVVENMSWMMRAIEDGFDVRGYFYWTLMDNYEWNQGMTGKPLGLYAVDGADPLKLREPRAIADVFAEVAAARSVPANLAERYPIRRRSLTE